MTRTYLRLTALDPIVARDGRPFGVGQRMKGLTWPYPSVVAGSFRTALIKAAGGDFTGDTPHQLKGVPVAGVFPIADDGLYLPAPYDCVLHPERGPLRAFPQSSGDGGCDFPCDALQPVMLAEEDAKDDFKPQDSPAWWPVTKIAGWMTNNHVEFNDTFLGAPVSQIRDHVQLDPNTGAAEESRLFSTVALNLTRLPRFRRDDRSEKDDRFAQKNYREVTLAARVDAPDWDVSTMDMLHPLGGERRLVHWRANGDGQAWKCPVAAALNDANRVRMTLATPAIFAHGWRPDWIDENTLTGSPPNSSVQLQLVGVCIPRWRAVSGWSLAEPRGPKPIRRLVAAGGVYFFESLGDPASLADRWLEPVSDDPQDRNDGFGLAVWGIW